MEMITYVAYMLTCLDMNAGFQMICTHAIVCVRECVSTVFVSMFIKCFDDVASKLM